MKTKNLVALFATLLIGISIAAGSVAAQADKVHQFDGTLADGTPIQVIYVPLTGKLGLITKNAQGEPTSAYMYYEVDSVENKFHRTSADTFGKVDDGLFVYFSLTGLQGSSISIAIDGGESQSLTGQEPVNVDSLRPFGNCRNYCYPSNPANYNWWQCFWCCATTGNNPCSNM